MIPQSGLISPAMTLISVVLPQPDGSVNGYQVVTQHRPGELVLQDTGLGYSRSAHVVLLTVVSRPRRQEQKTEFYRLLAEKLQAACGLSPDDLIVSLVENTDADWSFGRGRAQFLTGEL